ncbi:uncharacterized protein LOC120280402 isoform X3 [Dioscorea cayenensis subsp. rotundata]|uniref:Uncharacterized protein LOC120280402 isoform X3 n=1 Tax=Dioscorea cayennensis subsp. rotundata TaxID=55577 RepID=A0AB40CTG2_DIOCR|nr:uncharacterized protein LOC120280402 isoform X3 [Dioscorea cayenensis subsp. rotundata]
MLLPPFLCTWITQLLACMGSSSGCLGCSTKRANNNVSDEPSKGLHIQGPTVKKHSISEDFWSTSTFEMENNGVQSQRSLSSISASTQTMDLGSGSSHNPPEFVNHGLSDFGIILIASESALLMSTLLGGTHRSQFAGILMFQAHEIMSLGYTWAF